MAHIVQQSNTIQPNHNQSSSGHTSNSSIVHAVSHSNSIKSNKRKIKNLPYYPTNNLMEPGTQGNNSANASRPASSFSNGYPQHHNHSYGGPETSAQMGDDDVRFQFLYHQFKEFLDGGSQFN